MNIDWDKAPEWANAVVAASAGTLYFVEAFGIRSKRRAVSNSYDSGLVADMTIKSHSWKLVEARPKKKDAWDGVGKPPIGIECEVKINDMWHICKTLAYHQVSDTAVAVHFLDGSNSLFWCAAFRPIKTDEQLAEEEIQAIRDEIRWKKPELGPCPVAQLYNKGYRKQ